MIMIFYCKFKNIYFGIKLYVEIIFLLCVLNNFFFMFEGV